MRDSFLQGHGWSENKMDHREIPLIIDDDLVEAVQRNANFHEPSSSNKLLVSQHPQQPQGTTGSSRKE